MENGLPKSPPKVAENLGEATFFRHKTAPRDPMHVGVRMISHPDNMPRINHRGFGVDPTGFDIQESFPEGEEFLRQLADNPEMILSNEDNGPLG